MDQQLKNRFQRMLSALAPSSAGSNTGTAGVTPAAAGSSSAAFPPPSQSLLEVMAGLKDFDSPTIFNAVEKVTGDTTPSKCYTDHTIVNQLAELGSFIGLAVTVEVTTNGTLTPTAKP
jgi:hypothetical protein